MGISCAKMNEKNEEITQHKQNFNQMDSIQDDHCAGLSDLYAFDTKFPIPQNYLDDDEHISEIHLSASKEQSLNSHQSQSIQNQNFRPKALSQTLDSQKQTQKSMTSESDSLTFTYGKEKNQCKNHIQKKILELKCVLYTLKDSLNMRSKNTIL